MRTFSWVVIGRLFLAWGVFVEAAGRSYGEEDAGAEGAKFIRTYEENMRPLEIAVARAWWDANVTGSDEAFATKEALQNQLDARLASKEEFLALCRIREGAIADPIVRRQIDLLYLGYLGKQVDVGLLQRMTSLANGIEKKFNQYRARVGERTLTDSEVRNALLNSADVDERKRVWEASKAVGEVVVEELRQLVLLRNEAARKLGYKNFHAMQLALNEQHPDETLKLFDELDALTREPFARVKGEIDQALAGRYGIDVDALRPWHYHDPFFQEAQAVYEVDLDAPFRKVDILQVCRDFYAGIDLPIDDVLQRSDLYEKPNKSPHAFCTDIDREGDVRVLANVVPNAYWMSTMLHELGHAVYASTYIPPELPYLLRTDAHILTTEGVAMMFERFATEPAWLAAYGVQVEDPLAFAAAARRERRDKLLIFSRWCQVMYRFEMAMYDDATQDLNTLWWDLVEKYQLIHRPEARHAPDFASKIHVVSTPAYYHNYLLGELFACQLHDAIVRELGLPGRSAIAFYTREPRVGAFMKKRVFDPGKRLTWNELTQFATGSPLRAASFAAEFE